MFPRLFFLQPHVETLAAGGTITYQSGHYYNVPDELAQRLIDSKHAELDEVREARLLLEELEAKKNAELAAAAASELNAHDESSAAVDAIVPAAEHVTQPPTAE